MERRLPQRLEHLPHGLLNHPVDHVGNPQSALPASRLGYVSASRSACSLGSTVGHCSSSASIVCPSGPGAPFFDATFNNASVNRYATSSIVADAAVPVLSIACGAPARISPNRPGFSCGWSLAGFLLSRSAGKAAPPLLRPGPPSLARRCSTRHAQRALPLESRVSTWPKLPHGDRRGQPASRRRLWVGGRS